MSYGLSENTINKIINVFNNFAEVTKVAIYGSRAKGNYKSGSDIDLCLFGSSIDLTLKYKIEKKLDDLDLAYKCDVTIYDKLDNNDLIEHINCVGIIIYIKKVE